MVLRKLAMALLSIGVILPGLTHALALRDVKTKSALGEPFRAELDLSDLGDLTEEDIKVSLAQPEDFERLGIEQTYLLAELRFEVVVNRDGRSFIKIYSPKRVTEPFLDFIIRVTWPNNTRLHQITALLDPPASKLSRKAEPIQAPVVVKAEPVVQPVVKTIEQPVVVETPEIEVAEKSYTVRKFDTLWKIARKVRPNTAVPVAQMMKALHKANPDAFIANNINLLKDGQVLRVPNLNDVQSASEVAQQQANTPAVVQAQTKPLTHQQIDATKKDKVVVNAPMIVKPQMKLLAPTGQKTAQSTGLTEKSAKKEVVESSSVVSSKKVAVEKNVQKTEGYNQKLTQELSSLEQQLKLNDKKIAMQNAKLAHLEAQLKARRLAAEQQAKHKDKIDLEKKAVATMACAVALQTFVSSDAHAADAPAKSGGSSMMPIIGGGVVLLIVIAAIFILKGKSKKEATPVKPVAPTPPVAKPAAPVAPKSEPVAAPKVEPVKQAEPPKPQDPLDEVRPYLEMERYPQAVGLLTKALVQHPDRADIHVKLLEIFLKQKDRQAFDEQYQKLEVLGDLDAVVAADKLKAQFPEAPKPVVAEKAKVNEDGALEFQASKPAAVVEESPAMSLDDLENDFKMSLSSPNLQALDIPLAPDPVELQQPEEPITSKAEEAKISELDSLLDGGLEFSFSKDQPVAPAEEHKGLDFQLDDMKFDVAEVEEDKPNVGTNLSLDSLDDFLAEQKIETTEVEAQETNLSFEAELAKFKEEKQETDTADNLVEGLELEEFKLADESVISKEADLDFDLSVDFSLDEKPIVEENSDFDLDLDVATPTADLDDLAAKFDKQSLSDSELPEDDLDLDFDVSVSSDDVVAELDKEFSFLANTNENATRLELARPYLEMGDRLGARDLLEEVVAEGSADQKIEAQGMLMRIG